MARHNPPVGDMDLAGDRPDMGENIVDGGAGPSGSSATSTGRLGGMRDTSEGVGARADGEYESEVLGEVLDRGAQTTLGDIVSSAPEDPEDAEDEDEAQPDDREDGSIEAPSVSSPTRDVERAERVGSTETMRGETGGLAGTSR